MLTLRPRAAVAVVYAGLLGLLVHSHVRSADEKPEAKAKTIETKKSELHQLTNEDLLKQAAAIYGKAHGEYLAAVRALTGIETQLDEAAKQLEQPTNPKSALPKNDDPAKSKDTAAEEAAKTALDTAKGKAAAARRRLQLAAAAKALQDRQTSGIETVQSALSAFQAALEDLKPYGVEIELRFADGTMTGARPAELIPEALARKRKELAAEEVRLRTRLEAARKAVEAGAKGLLAAENDVGAAEAEVTEASRVFAREQQRKETEKKYAGKQAEELLAAVNQLVQDGAGLKGTYELAFREFMRQAGEAELLGQQLTELKQPVTRITQITRAEDVQQAAKSVEALIEYYTVRMQKVEVLKTTLTVLIKLGTEFEADAAVSDDHLFQMQVLAGLIDRAGGGEQLPPQARLNRLAEAVERAKKLAAEVRAGTTRAKADLPVLDKALLEARTARAAATEQLAALKQTQDATLAALRFEEQLAKLTAPQAIEEFNRLRKQLAEQAPALKAQEEAFKQAAVAAVDARNRYEALKDPLLRAAEEQGLAEKQKLLAELRKEAGLERGTAPTSPGPATPREEKQVEEKKPDAGSQKPEPVLGPVERATLQLSAFQQQLAARVRVLGEREAKAVSLLAALDELEQTATAYARTLAETRKVALELNAVAVDIKKRVGRGDMDSAQIPPGVTEALSAEHRKKFEADSATVLNALSQARQDRDAIRKPDPEAEALKQTTTELLTLVGQRIDLLGDLKKLTADYKLTRKDRTDSVQKRLDQTATERMEKDAGRWDWLLRVDQSKAATGLVELMESYYREVVDLEEKEENLRKQKQKYDSLIEIVNRERAAIQRAAPLLAKQLVRLETAREEESVLARATLKPDSAEELLKAYQTRTSRVLPKPLPVPEKERTTKVEQLAGSLFQRHVELVAANKWNEIIAGRLTPAGLTAETGVYQDELAELNAASGAIARRVQILTGTEPQDPGKLGSGEQTRLPATGGEIGKTRGELTAVRRKGVQSIGIRIGVILLVALLLPRVILFVLRRALGAHSEEPGSSSMVLSALAAFLRVAVWVVALAVILSVLGFDVTAIIAGLGIGGLAIGLAAQPMIADVIAAIVIFAERRFKIGDVIKLGNEDPARVVGLSWRSTALKNSSGLVVTVPNRKVTEAWIQNLTRSGQTYDSLSATITTTRDVNAVLKAIQDAMATCENLSTDHGVSVKKFTQKAETKIVEYRFWWFLHDYESRDRTRDEVFARIAAGLADENMSGTEVTLT